MVTSHSAQIEGRIQLQSTRGWKFRTMPSKRRKVTVASTIVPLHLEINSAIESPEDEYGEEPRCAGVNDGSEDLRDDLVEFVEGSRSRSEEDLDAIGGATRIEDTAASPWKEPDSIGWGDNFIPSQQSEEGKDYNRSIRVPMDGDNDLVGAERKDVENRVQTADFMDAEMLRPDSAGEESKSENETPASEGEDSLSDSDAGSVGKDSPKESAYSRAFSKIFKSKSVTQSEIGPVLSANQALVARKLEEETSEPKDKKDARKEKKELREKAHLYPQSYTDTKEKDLVKLATRGVVKLFNAVSKTQNVQAKANTRDAKMIAKRSKSAFLSEMKSSGKAVSLSGRSLTAPQSNDITTSRWSVVQDDFMLGRPKLKDWDKAEIGGIERTNLEDNQLAGSPEDNEVDSEED